MGGGGGSGDGCAIGCAKSRTAGASVVSCAGGGDCACELADDELEEIEGCRAAS